MSDQNDDKIDKFLRDEASDEERKALSKQADLQGELEFRQNLQGALGKESRQLMKNKLVQLDQKIVSQQRKRRFIIIGITLAVLVGSFIIWSKIESNSGEFELETPEQIFAANFEPYPNIIAPIVKGDNDITEREKAFQLYEQGNYEAATQIFNKLWITDSDTAAHFYDANIFLKVGESQLAIRAFQDIFDANHSVFSEPAEWYLALAYIKSNDIEKAKEILAKISLNDNHPYQKKAKELSSILLD